MRRDGGFSKEAHFEPALKDDDSGPTGVVLLLLAVMTRGGTLATFPEPAHPACELLVLVYSL